MVMPHYLTTLQEKDIDVWLPVQAAFADALNDRTDLPIHLNQMLHALNYKHTALYLQGYIRGNDMRFAFSEKEAQIVSEVHRIYYEYLQSVFLYNPKLYVDLKSKEYQIHLYGTVLIVEY